MARTNAAKTEPVAQEVLAVLEVEDAQDSQAVEVSETSQVSEASQVPEVPEEAVVKKPSSQPVAGAQEIDECLNALKTLLTSVEKLQKVRQEVGDIKPLLLKMLDGEVVSGEDLEQLKTGVSGLFRLVRAYADHQTALANAQPARQLLDEVLKVRDTKS